MEKGKACNLLEGLNKGLPKLGIGKTNRLRKQFNLSPAYSLNSSMASNLTLNKSSQMSSLNNVSEYSGDCECTQSNKTNSNEAKLCCSAEKTNKEQQANKDCCGGIEAGSCLNSCISTKS